MNQDQDGLGGTDNVRPLFSSRPSAAPLPPQQDVVNAVAGLLSLANEGKLTGLIIVAFDEKSNGSSGMVGKCPYADAIGILEDMKFKILLANSTRKEK